MFSKVSLENALHRLSEGTSLEQRFKKGDYKKGDIIKINRGVYKHYGVYNGSGVLYHVRNGASPDVEGEPVEHVVGKDHCQKGNDLDMYLRPFAPDEIVKRARDKCGPFAYDEITNNCEHFANWCRYGMHYSSQANDPINLLVLAAARTS